MKRTQRLSLVGILLIAVAIGTVACGDRVQTPSVEDEATDGAIETVSLKIEGMT